MSTGNKAIPDLPAIPDPTGGSLYITKDNTDYRVDTGGIGGLATLGADGKLAAGQMPTVASLPWSGITGKPTTLAGYGITDAVLTTNFTFANLGGKPTTISGYGITDNTFANLSSKPTTLSGYGITDATTTTAMNALLAAKKDVNGTGGISFGATFAPSDTDPSTHIALHNLNYGINVTSGLQNYFIPSGSVHSFLVNGTQRLAVNGTGIAVTGAITATGNITGYSSDKRLKTNIKNIEDPMGKLYKIGGYTFDWDMKKCFVAGFHPDNPNEHGVLAQEVQKIMPDAVTPAAFDPSYLTVNYARLVPLLIECIKDLQTQIDELKTAQANQSLHHIRF